jgi:geranylgeranyl diphosphate synthase type II
MNTEKSYENFADLRHFTEKYLPQIETSLRECLPPAPPKIEKEFNLAVETALFSGEKRIRPILTLLGAELFGGKAKDVLPAAAAVEFIYTSSAILEDLPFFNPLKTSRENISVAEKYGEGLAVVVALALLNAAYPLVFVNHIGMPERAMQAHAEIVECVGASGLIGGQTIDLKIAEGADSSNFADDFHIESTKGLKTSALMRLALRIGAILAGADYLDSANLVRFAGFFGDAFQISEDSAISRINDSNQNELNNLIEEAKRFLIENFPSNEARSCLIQLTEYLAEGIE